MTTLEFANACSFTRAADGKITIAWSNGNAVNAVRGAAVDYVDPKFHMAVTSVDNKLTYAPRADLKRLTDGGIVANLALVVVGMRRVCSSFKGVELNIAEVAVVEANAEGGSIAEGDWKKLTGNVSAFKALLDIGPTILGMNGLSLMLKGHNYIETDSMWARLEAAADVESLVNPLGLMDYAGILFHDALHPFTAEWKVKLASDVTSALVGHVNGVLVKRMPGVPAGTAIVFVTLAALREISLLRPAASKATADLHDALSALADRIRAKPLEWCAVFQRSMTADNLANVTTLEPLCAFMYGACSVLFDRKVSIMKSASFKNNASRHTAMTAVGKEWAETLDAAPMDANAIAKMFKRLVASVKLDPITEDEEEEESEAEGGDAGDD